MTRWIGTGAPNLSRLSVTAMEKKPRLFSSVLPDWIRRSPGNRLLISWILLVGEAGILV